jgi:hypothetical protein
MGVRVVTYWRIIKKKKKKTKGKRRRRQPMTRKQLERAWLDPTAGVRTVSSGLPSLGKRK